MKVVGIKITNNGEKTIEFWTDVNEQDIETTVPLYPGRSVRLTAPDHPDLTIEVLDAVEKDIEN